MKSTCVLLVLALCGFRATIAQEKLKIEILYESLCPDSVRFITQQLYPTWPKIAAYSNLLFVPFGKAASTNGGEPFFCQHGPEECAGNKLQSCTLKRAEDQTVQLEFVNCYMDDVNLQEGDGIHCIEKAGVSVDEVNECTESSEGTQLQLEAEKETGLYKPSFVPTIVYNDEFDQDAQDASIANFELYICARLQETYPDACL